MQWRSHYFLALVTTVAFIVFFSWSMRRDLELNDEIPAAREEIPIELDDVEVTRPVGEDLWHVTAHKVFRYSREDRMEGIASDLTGQGGVRHLWAPSGRFLREQEELILDDPKGDWIREVHPFTWEGPRAIWRQREDRWIFPEGVVVRGDTFALDGARAEMDAQKRIRVEGGTILWWSEE